MKDMLNIELQDVKNVMAAKGYEIFTGPVPNIVGIRNAARSSNTFNDRCFVWWHEGEQEASHFYTITTHPGFFYLKNPIKGTLGTAILVPGQYNGCWEIAMHRGKQLALCQNIGQVRVYRDDTKDEFLNYDPKTIDTGFFGINLHHGGLDGGDIIGPWSAGCQVWKYADAHIALMELLSELSKVGNFTRFTYTLLQQEDFI